MEYLAKKYSTQKDIQLLDPSVVSTFLYCQNDKDELEDMFAPLKLQDANTLVLLPMNDSTSPDITSSGSHWTLLV